MFYKFIDLPNLPQIQTDVLNFVNSKEFALDPNEPHSIRFADSWQHIQSVVNAVETICAWQHVNYISWCLTSPNGTFTGLPHIDSASDDEEYPWALNIPIAGCQESYVNFYHHKNKVFYKILTSNTPHQFNERILRLLEQIGKRTNVELGPYRYTSLTFNEQDLELVESCYLHKPAFFNTREVHLQVNNSSTPRHVITVRFHVDLRKYNLGLT